jgi:hypothetical protein
MAKSTKLVGKRGASGTFLPTTPSGTGETGYYDPETGSTVPRARPTTDDLRVGKSPPTSVYRVSAWAVPASRSELDRPREPSAHEQYPAENKEPA